jgi:glycosyltransferase involved in cell wall biosynthesis
MKISVIIPTFNSAKFFSQTLATVYKQNYHPHEVIVVDGSSTDKTRKIVEAYGPFVTKFISEPDKGQLDAVQKGIHISKGDVVYWINADDAVMPGAFECAANVFAADPSVEIVFGDNFWFNEETRQIGVVQSVKHLSFWDQFLFYGQLQVEAFFCRRELAYKALPFDTNLRVYTDYSYFLPVRYGEKCKWVPQRLGAFRVHPGQMHRVNIKKGRTERELVKQFRSLQQRHALHYYFYQKIFPKTVSAVRFLLRKSTGDFRRRRLARFFFDEWLLPPSFVEKRLKEEAAQESQI